MSDLTLQDVLYFDCETTGLPEKGLDYKVDFDKFPRIVSLSWEYQGVLKHKIAKPDGWIIPDEAAAIHGITTEIAMQKGEPIIDILSEFFTDCASAPLICAHNVYFDTSMIKSEELRSGFDFRIDVESALYKGKRIDTMWKTIKFVGALKENGKAGKFPTLEELYVKLFPNEKFEAHRSDQDVLALKRCLPELVKLGLIELKVKEYNE
jgi:DNA polymerase III epsilon subunit-like protein